LYNYITYLAIFSSIEINITLTISNTTKQNASVITLVM